MPLVKLKITPAVLDLFNRHRLITSETGEQRFKIGDMIGVSDNAQLESYAHILKGRLIPPALGAFSYSHSDFNSELSVGRYCSISWGLDIIAGDHPLDWVTTASFTHHPFQTKGVEAYLRDTGVKAFNLQSWPYEEKPAVLGHDVWVGMRVLIKRGITIGQGAAIGAGSVVVRDVPPYAIVAGVPARVIRYRFSETVIERLLKCEWWRYGPEVVQPLDVRDPEGFLGRLDQAVATGAKSMDLPVLTGQAIIAAGEIIP